MNLEAEESVLGAALMSPAALNACSELVAPADFYYPRNGLIFGAALELSNGGTPVDQLTLADHLDKQGKLGEAGGRVRLGELVALTPSTGNAAHYARIVHDMAQLRALLAAGQAITHSVLEREGATKDLVERAQKLVYAVGGTSSGDLEPIKTYLRQAVDHAAEMQDSPDGMIGTPSGLVDLDKLTLGFHPGDLVIVAGLTSMGKSSLAFNITQHVALRQKLPVAFFTLEMTPLQVAQRLLASESRVPLQKIRSGQLNSDEWRSIVTAAEEISAAPLYLDGSTDITALAMRGKLRRLKQQHERFGLAIVDYLQQMVDGEVQYRVQEVGKISRALKLTALDVGIPLLALSQLNRRAAEEKREPRLSDLRDSGSLEQDSDVVIFVHRENKEATEGVLIVDKQRMGPRGRVNVTWRPTVASFGNAAPRHLEAVA